MSEVNSGSKRTIWTSALLVLLCAFVVYSYVVSALYVRINEDAAFYIGVSQLMSDGKVPFVDFLPGYTPLSFYLMCVPLGIFGDSYVCAIITLYLIQFVNALLVYQIVVAHTQQTRWAWLAALLFLLYSLFLDGRYYVLEPFVLLFGLLSVKLLIRDSRWHLFLAGFFCFCSFWSKQYGLGFIFLALLYEIAHFRFSKTAAKNTFLILSGFVVCAVLFLLLALLQGADLTRMLILSGADYEKNGFAGLVTACVFLLKIMPVLLLAFLTVIFFFKKSVKDGFLMMSLAGIIGFMLQFYVRYYYHYFLLALPFMIFLVFLSVKLLSKVALQKVYVSIIALSTMLPLYFVATENKNVCSQRLRIQQENISEQLSELIPKGEKDILVSQEVLYAALLNRYTPPLIQKYGLSNGFVTAPDEMLDMCQHAQCCIISESNYNKGKAYSDVVKQYLNDNFRMESMSYEYGEMQGKLFVFKRIL